MSSSHFQNPTIYQSFNPQPTAPVTPFIGQPWTNTSLGTLSGVGAGQTAYWTGTIWQPVLYPPGSTTSVAGVVQLATPAQTVAGTSTTLAVTPAGVAAGLATISSPQPGATTPLVESGAGSVGVSAYYARADHVHPAYSGGGSGGMTTVFYTGSGSFTVPAGVNNVTVYCVGGGTIGLNCTYGQGCIFPGISPAYGASVIGAAAVTPGQVISVVVGGGNLSPGYPAGNSAFGSFVTAAGGNNSIAAGSSPVRPSELRFNAGLATFSTAGSGIVVVQY